MSELSESALLEKIKQRQTFTATIEGGDFTLKISRYEPALSAAIHNGGNFRKELVENCLLGQSERYYEEDPHTGSFIDQQPITLIAHDSRYEYDLNRNTDDCVYETAWGKEIWKKPLTKETIAESTEKHARFYRVVSALVEALIEDFGECIVYDMHSYNFKRHARTDLPVFNVGTSSANNEKWRGEIDRWLTALTNIKVDGVDITAAENDIFQGKGFLAFYCHKRYENVLVLATEVKKVFMDERSGEADPKVLPSMQQRFNEIVSTNTAGYVKN
jgi:hypothetical protein